MSFDSKGQKMPKVNRYVRGRQNLIPVPIASATVVEKGDMVCISSGKAVPPSVLLASGSESASAAAAQNAVAAAFVGISEDSSAAGDTDAILVDISLDAVYKLEQETAAAVSVGDGIGVYAGSTASASYTGSDSSVAATSNDPIARVVEEHASAAGTGTLCILMPQQALRSVSWASALS